MRSILLAVAVFSCFAVALPTPAAAEVRQERDVRKTTEVNAVVSVGWHGIYDGNTCKSLDPPRLVLTVPPQNGALCMELEESRGPQERPIPDHSSCVTRVGTGWRVFYRPARGFAGSDAFQYQIDYGTLAKIGDTQENWNVTVTVNGAGRAQGFQRQPSGPIPSCRALVS